MQSMAATAVSSSSSVSRGWAAVRRCASPSLVLRHVAFSSSSSSSSCCQVVGAGAPVLPLGIRGGRLLLPCPLLPEGGKNGPATRRMTAAAAAAASPSAEGGGKPGIPRTLQLGAMILVWYLLNIYFNIYNKLVLKAVPFPYTITTFQFLSGSFFITLMWLLNLHPKPRLSLQQYAKILPLAIIHVVMGNAFTNMSLGKVAVSFTHTIKAMEPFFSVLLSALFLGQAPSLLILGSLVPVVGGVVLASMTEVSFNWIGFWSAMASNVTNQSRNVFSKKLLADKEVSYSLLARISPVTHSVANSVKRVVVIVSSVIFFRTPISPINAFGTAVALVGVFLYSQFKKAKPKTKTA
ncbi:hypothetical protein ACQ4PT_024333 [Festuca glaucescens]